MKDIPRDELPLVSIITVNYNQLAITTQLLTSLRLATYPNMEIWVVDNGSPDDDPDILQRDFPEIKLIKSLENLGFAGGNNLAVRQAKGKHLLFINNDTEVPPDFLEPLVTLMENDPSIGMVSPKIRFHHTPDTIQYAGYTPMNLITLRQNLVGYREVDHGQYDETCETESIHGAAMMVRRSVIQEVGMMAELFFLYYEEHDWAARIKKANYKIFYEPRSLIYHKESMTTGKESPLKTYYITRNRFLYARRNLTGWVRFVCLLYLSFIAFPKGFLTYLARGRFDLSKSVWRAYFWNFLKFNQINLNPEL